MDGERDGVIVRTLQPEDAPRLVRMDQAITGRNRTAWYEGKLKRALEESDLKISLGAEVDGCLVGAVLGSLHYGEFGQPGADRRPRHDPRRSGLRSARHRRRPCSSSSSRTSRLSGSSGSARRSPGTSTT